MAGLTLKNISKVYPGGVSAVEDANIDVADGEFVVLVGPSGCGKSTTLRMIAGLEKISSGVLTIGEREVNNVEPGERDIAMVFQNYALYPHMSVRGNMSYGLKNEGLPKDQIAQRISEAAQMLRLTELLDRKPRQLSGGQRQRVAMGRAIVRHPAVFLFDEPLSNLDAKLRTELRGELKALHQRLAGTFIYVTHDQIEAMSLADRIVVMNAGRIEQIGTPGALYRRPDTRFVAEFIGNPAMNMIDGVIGQDGQSLEVGGQSLIRFAGPVAAPGQTVACGLRPEHCSFGGSGFATLDLDVSFEEQLGADTLVHGTIAGSSTAFVVRIDGEAGRAASGSLGASVDNLHVFDPQTGARIDVTA